MCKFLGLCVKGGGFEKGVLVLWKEDLQKEVGAVVGGRGQSQEQLGGSLGRWREVEFLGGRGEGKEAAQGEELLDLLRPLPKAFHVVVFLEVVPGEVKKTSKELAEGDAGGKCQGLGVLALRLVQLEEGFFDMLERFFVPFQGGGTFPQQEGSLEEGLQRAVLGKFVDDISRWVPRDVQGAVPGFLAKGSELFQEIFQEGDFTVERSGHVPEPVQPEVWLILRRCGEVFQEQVEAMLEEEGSLLAVVHRLRGLDGRRRGWKVGW